MVKCGSTEYVFVNINSSFAFATGETLKPIEPFISIEFVKAPIFLKSYYITTLCGASKELFVEGEDDDQTWHEIDHITTPLKDNSEALKTCKNPGKYRKFRFRQVGVNNDNHYGLQINRIRLFGSFLNIKECTNTKHYREFPFFIHILIISS